MQHKIKYVNSVFFLRSGCKSLRNKVTKIRSWMGYNSRGILSCRSQWGRAARRWKGWCRGSCGWCCGPSAGPAGSRTWRCRWPDTLGRWQSLPRWSRTGSAHAFAPGTEIQVERCESRRRVRWTEKNEKGNKRGQKNKDTGQDQTKQGGKNVGQDGRMRDEEYRIGRRKKRGIDR